MSVLQTWRVLGLDIGIASIGWTILERIGSAGRVLAAGVYAFQPPEQKDGSGKAAESNKKRHGDVKRRRRQTAKRAERMKNLRRLLHAHKPQILPDAGRHALAEALRRCAKANDLGQPKENITPWRLRKEGLERLLTADEWAIVLGHLVGHRAYLSNAKRRANDPKENDKSRKEEGKLLKALSENDGAFSRAVQRGDVTTIGEWLGGFDRQRNRSGDYRYSVKREWIADEARLLFSRQRERNSDLASRELEKSIIYLIEHQEKITTKPVHKCTFEPDQDRAARHSYSFELFRVLQRLNNIRIISPRRISRRLNTDEIARVVADFGEHQTITYKTVRNVLKLTKDEQFDHVPTAEAEGEDIVARKGKGVQGTSALRQVIIDNHGKPTWESLLDRRDTLDGIAAAIAHHDDLGIIRQNLAPLGLEPALVETLVRQANGGKLGFFKGTGHLSLKALQKLEPHLLSGHDYHESQIKAGYDPAKDRYSRKPGIVGNGPDAVRKWLRGNQLEELITNQVASRAVRETFKQVLAIIAEHHVDAIHIEMAREIGKSPKAREEIETDQRIRESRRERLRKSFSEIFGHRPSEAEETRWALWTDQKGKCAFTGEDMHCTWVAEGDARVQVEHILPRSRFRIDSMDNKVLCLASANQNKRSSTPYEWLKDGKGPVTWEVFRDRAQHMFKGKEHRRKLEKLLLVDTTKLEGAFKNRDLNDTRWIAKFLLAGLEKLSKEDHPIHVQPVNAGLVRLLRHGWGLDRWKRDPNDPKKRRPDDRHHALDAAIIATIDQRLVGRLTKAYQEAEKLKRDFPIKDFPPPWKDFRRDLIDHIYGHGATDAGPEMFVADPNLGIFVVRPENRRTRGPVHKENYYPIRKSSDGVETAYEYIAIENFEEKHLTKVKDRDRQGPLIAKLEDWIQHGRPMNQLPTWAYRNEFGEKVDYPLRRVRIESRHRPSIRIETGDDRNIETPKPSVASASGAIVRVDLFTSPDGRVQLVPIYRYHLSSATPPNEVITNGVECPLEPGSRFRLSIYPKSYVRVTKAKGQIIDGYFRYFDRESSRIELAPQHTFDRAERERISPSAIQKLEKLAMNRLGLLKPKGVEENMLKVRSWPQETRTWRGVACT